MKTLHLPNLHCSLHESTFLVALVSEHGWGNQLASNDLKKPSFARNVVYMQLKKSVKMCT
jgi:hypothetical protein